MRADCPPQDPSSTTTQALPRPWELEAMQRALTLAERGAATVLPNPVVGCVLLSPTGEIVGEGWHEQAGQAHAEVNALNAAGSAARGATAVVTLEPCNHQGRTGPCTQALIGAGVSRVVIGQLDPNPKAAGGVAELRAAGVQVLTGALQAEAADLNRVWLAGVAKKRPFVTFKAGTSLDGRIAAPDGTSKWITSPASRADVHLLRSRVDTMLVGIGTVLADDPLLTVRDALGAPLTRQPLRVIADSAGRTPDTAKVLNDQAESWVATVNDVGAGPDGRINLPNLLDLLFARGKRHVLLEGGPHLAAAFLDAGLIDEIIVYLAPLTLGAGKPAFEGSLLATLADAQRWQLRDVTRFEDDVRLRYASGR